MAASNKLVLGRDGLVVGENQLVVSGDGISTGSVATKKLGVSEGITVVGGLYANGTKGTSGSILKTNGSDIFWSTGGTSIYSGANPPSDPASGQGWLDTDTGILYTYVVDGDSAQWVELGPYNVVSPTPYFNLDGGAPNSTYGGISVVDAGGVT